jgi:hypothetical protein
MTRGLSRAAITTLALAACLAPSWRVALADPVALPPLPPGAIVWDMRGSIVPDTFTLYDPVDFAIEVAAVAAQGERAYLGAFQACHIGLTLVEGDAKGITILPQNPWGHAFHRSIVTLAYGERHEEKIPLHDLVRIDRAGQYRLCWGLMPLVSQEGDGKRLVLCRSESHVLSFTVFPRPEKELRLLLAELSRQLDAPKLDPEVLRRLLPISHPLAIPLLSKAWERAHSADGQAVESPQRSLARAFMRIGTDAAMERLADLLSSMASFHTQICVMYDLEAYARDPVIRPHAIRIWEWGSQSPDKDVRANAERALKEYR